MNRIMILLMFCFLLPTWGVEAAERKKKDKQDSVKVETEYDKLFKGPGCETAEGMITLHKKDGRVYFEMPLRLMGKEMLLGSTVEEISDNNEALVGQKPHTPLHIYFTKIDSAVQMRYVYNVSISKDKNIQRAIETSNIGAILENFPVKCMNNEKDAVVFDVTDFLVSDREEIDPFDPNSASTYFGWMLRISKFKKERSFIGDIKAFEDNISVTSHLSYGVTMRALGMFEYQTDKPFTALVKRSLMLLPEKPMRPRIADPRVGLFFSGKMDFTTEENRMDVVYYAHRWRLEPKDTLAYERGELVEPIKPIVFYVDPNFPEKWTKYIYMGIEDWNLAFEKIGFKNAVQARPFPTDDPEFDPDNIKYSCVRYAPLPVENAMGPSWVDPRTGEILNASVFIYHNAASLVYNWRVLQTGAVDPRVRGIKLPEDVLGESIRYVVRHEIGHCCGLMHNMGASSAFPTDSLRSVTFTQKYGTTPSIMDYARYNYVAQPGDYEKGVSLTPPILGPYDYHAIRWAYQPILEVQTAEEEVPILDQWVSEKIKDPMYRYGKQQFTWPQYDPRALAEDLGDDAMKASANGIKNLKYVMENINDWVDADDKDYSFRSAIYYSILMQYRQYISNVQPIIGGIYLNEKYVGDPFPVYQSVPKEKQKEAVQFILSAMGDVEWLDNEDFLKNLPIVGSPASTWRKTFLSSLITSAPDLALCCSKSEDPYTQEEFLTDIYAYVFGPTMKGASLLDWQREAQITWVNTIIESSEINAKDRAGNNGFAIAGTQELSYTKLVEREWQEFLLHAPDVVKAQYAQQAPIQGIGFQNRVRAEFPSIAPIYYEFLLKTQKQLQRSRHTGDANTQAHYVYLLKVIQDAMKIE